MSRLDKKYSDDEDNRYSTKKSSSSRRSPIRDRDRDDKYRDRDDKYRDRDDKYRDRSRSKDRDRSYRDKDDKYREREKDIERKPSDKYKERDKKSSSYKRDRKHYSDDSDSSSGSSSDDSDYDRKRKSSSSSKESKEERRKRKKEEKREKELRKANETPEEKRKRRLEKKQKKEANKKSDLDLSGYSNNTNPFNDQNLQEKFVWKAKRDKLIKEGMKADEYDEKYSSKKRREEIQQEISKAKSKREQREKEKEIWEEEKERLQRMRDMSNNEELEKKEEEFHYIQACKRCETRLLDNRPKAIDYLYKAIHMLSLPWYNRDSGVNNHLADPVLLIQAVKSQQDLDELIEGVREFTYLETDKDTLEFWEEALQLAQYQQTVLEGNNVVTSDSTALHQSLTPDILAILSDKSHQQLCTLESEIIGKLESGSAMNVEYWETLLKHLKVFKSCSFLKERFIQNIKLKHSDLETEKYLKEIANNMDLPFGNQQQEGGEDSGAKSTTATSTADGKDKTKKEDEFDEDNDFDEQFDLEVALEPKYYSWHDKFRPRKPKFFNRVHTGYDWTKYNRTHYDYDNPPPKVVRGYKFNIFYPDLIDNTKSPQFFVSPSPDNPDTCILRFSAGPPYEDIAFKIVKKEWEKSHKYGYKCVFDDKGVLHLWFNFKRYRYRR